MGPLVRFFRSTGALGAALLATCALWSVVTFVRVFLILGPEPSFLGVTTVATALVIVIAAPAWRLFERYCAFIQWKTSPENLGEHLAFERAVRRAGAESIALRLVLLSVLFWGYLIVGHMEGLHPLGVTLRELTTFERHPVQTLPFEGFLWFGRLIDEGSLFAVYGSAAIMLLLSAVTRRTRHHDLRLFLVDHLLLSRYDGVSRTRIEQRAYPNLWIRKNSALLFDGLRLYSVCSLLSYLEGLGLVPQGALLLDELRSTFVELRQRFLTEKMEELVGFGSGQFYTDEGFHRWRSTLKTSEDLDEARELRESFERYQRAAFQKQLMSSWTSSSQWGLSAFRSWRQGLGEVPPLHSPLAVGEEAAFRELAEAHFNALSLAHLRDPARRSVTHFQQSVVDGDPSLSDEERAHLLTQFDSHLKAFLSMVLERDAKAGNRLLSNIDFLSWFTGQFPTPYPEALGRELDALAQWRAAHRKELLPKLIAERRSLLQSLREQERLAVAEIPRLAERREYLMEQVAVVVSQWVAFRNRRMHEEAQRKSRQKSSLVGLLTTTEETPKNQKKRRAEPETKYSAMFTTQRSDSYDFTPPPRESEPIRGPSFTGY